MIIKACFALSLLCIITGCTQHRVDTTHKVELEVKPMHITIDVNLKVDKELDDFFGDIDKQDATMEKEKENEKK
jgi:hypothetical protein